jgi:universal stress protein A
MITIKRILYPTDFSDCAKTAEEYATALADQFQAELHVLNVLADVKMMLPGPGSALSLPQNYLLDLITEAERTLAKVLPDAAKSGRTVVRTLRTGNPHVEIVKYAEAMEIDLIVMGTHGRGGLAHMLLGSVAEKLVRTAGCPVLTVRPAEQQFVAP